MTEEVQAVRRQIQHQNLRARVLAVEQDMCMRGVRPVETGTREPAKNVEEKRLLLRQSREKLRQAQEKLEECERDVNVMRHGGTMP